MSGDMCPNTNTTDGQIVVITGGNGGIGKMVCQELCNRKGHVIIASKDPDKMDKVKHALLKNNPRATVEVRYLDLRSFDCVRRFVKQLGTLFFSFFFGDNKLIQKRHREEKGKQL